MSTNYTIKNGFRQYKEYYFDGFIFYIKDNPKELLIHSNNMFTVRNPFPKDDYTEIIYYGKQLKTAIKYLLGINKNNNPTIEQ